MYKPQNHLQFILDTIVSIEQYTSKDETEFMNDPNAHRNVIAHGYREVDFTIIWNIITTKLSQFKESIEKAL